MKSLQSWCIFICAIYCLSCSQVLDVDQVNGYELNTSFTVPLIYFDVSEPSLIGALEFRQKSNIKFFDSYDIKENLSKIEFNFKVVNELTKDVTIQILLLDSEDSLLYKIETSKIVAKSLEYQLTQILEMAVLPEIRNFARVEILINLEDPILAEDILDMRVLHFKSDLTMYFSRSL